QSLRWTNGIGGEETGRALLRARELCTQVDESPELFAVLQGLLAHQNIRRSDPSTLRDVAEQLLTLAEHTDDPAKLMTAHGALGLELLVRGEFATALKHLEEASPSLDWSRTSGFGVFYPGFGAWALWALGYPDQAIKWSRHALAVAEALSRPEMLANALAVNTTLHVFMRDPQMARQGADVALAMASEHGLRFELAHAAFSRGWALARESHLNEGITEMRRAKADLEALGFARPRFFAPLAEASAKLEGPDAGLKLL